MFHGVSSFVFGFFQNPEKKHTHNIQRVLAGTPPPESLEDFVYMFLALLLMSFSLL